MPVPRRLSGLWGRPRFFSSGNQSRDSSRRCRGPFPALTLAVGKRASSRAPLGRGAPGGAGPEPRAAGLGDLGLSADGCGFKFAL